jgi:hypothetical protein
MKTIRVLLSVYFWLWTVIFAVCTYGEIFFTTKDHGSNPLNPIFRYLIPGMLSIIVARKANSQDYRKGVGDIGKCFKSCNYGRGPLFLLRARRGGSAMAPRILPRNSHFTWNRFPYCILVKW